MEKFKIHVTILKDGVLKKYYTYLGMDKSIVHRHKRIDRIGKYVLQNPEKFTNKCLCWNCSNYTRCTKILDINKKEITSYPFITGGFQIKDLYHDENKLERKSRDLDGLSEAEKLLRNNDLHIAKFIVTGCKNFKYK